jgi:predicted transcriptional regulator
VGHYVDASFGVIAGMADNERQVMFAEGEYFPPERINANIIWYSSGFIAYSFSNMFSKKNKIKELTSTLEICSETFNYQNDWKSDITFSINNQDLVTYLSPGDLGGQRVLLNPSWWPNNATQFGILIKLTITEIGGFLNGVLSNTKVNLSTLEIYKDHRLTLTIQNKSVAVHIGGFNIFGKHFGDYEQDILLTAIY